MVGGHERQASDDDAGERLARKVDPGPETVGAEEHALTTAAECLEHPRAGESPALHDEIPTLLLEEARHPRRHCLHRAVAGEEDEGARAALPGEMPDPFRKRLLVGRILRLGHLADEADLHLPGVIEGGAELQRGNLKRTHPAAEIIELRGADREGRAGHDGGASLAEKKASQQRRDGDRRRMETGPGGGLAASLDPVDVIRFALGEEIGKPRARRAQTRGDIVELSLQSLLLGFCRGGSGRFGKARQAFRERTLRHGLREIRRLVGADAAFTPLAEGAGAGQLVEEAVDLRNEIRCRGNPPALPRLLQEALAGAGVVEALDGLAQAVLGEVEAEMAGGDLLDGVCLVEDHEIIWKEVTEPLLLGISQQGEEERVIENENVGRLGASPRGLVEAA